MQANIDPGLETLMQYAKMERLQARLPPPEHVAKAFADFFNYRHQAGEAIEDIQAQYASQAFIYLQKTQAHASLASSSMRHALVALAVHSHQSSPAHAELIVNLYETLCQRASSAPSWLMHLFIKALCSVNQTTLAREYLLGTKGEYNREVSTSPSLWDKILRGYAKEIDQVELRRTLELMNQNGVSTQTAQITQTMAEFSASIDDAEGARTWYEQGKQIDNKGPSKSQEQAQAHREDLQNTLLRLCIRTSQLEFGQSIIRDIMTTTPSKRQWDLIFAWAAGTGKGVDEIDRMMGVMEKANRDLPEGEHRVPDVETINSLVELAISRKDPYMAERFIALGKRRDIQPDARTLVLQMDYRLSVNDVDGALVAYKHLQSHDVADEQDVLAVNRLICAMCASGRQDFDSIMNVAADLSDRRARFEPTTVSALSLLHLSREELHDVTDLLNTHIFKFSVAERAFVRDTFVSYCVDPSTTTTKAWDAYLILKQMFDETRREQRTQLMNDFFRRGRADMGVHVFSHMRAHTRPDTISNVETYVSCFLGIAKLQDQESLEVVYNQMKLDYSVEPNTHLLNALMLAYTACESPRRALAFWDEIASSREGPTINSIHLAFRACEASPWGDQKAREIWARLNRTGIELDQAMWASYAAGLVGNGDVLSAVAILEKAHAESSVEMSALV